MYFNRKRLIQNINEVNYIEIEIARTYDGETTVKRPFTRILCTKSFEKKKKGLNVYRRQCI